jgi:hypothetical protein
MSSGVFTLIGNRVNRYKYIQNKPSEAKEVEEFFEPKVGEIWVKKDGGLYITLDRRLVPSHNVVIWEGSFSALGRTEVVQISHETLLRDYYQYKGMTKHGYR